MSGVRFRLPDPGLGTEVVGEKILPRKGLAQMFTGGPNAQQVIYNVYGRTEIPSLNDMTLERQLAYDIIRAIRDIDDVYARQLVTRLDLADNFAFNNHFEEPCHRYIMDRLDNLDLVKVRKETAQRILYNRFHFVNEAYSFVSLSAEEGLVGNRYVLQARRDVATILTVGPYNFSGREAAQIAFLLNGTEALELVLDQTPARVEYFNARIPAVAEWARAEIDGQDLMLNSPDGRSLRKEKSLLQRLKSMVTPSRRARSRSASRPRRPR